MWVFTNTAFISAVEHRDDDRVLVVRARLKGDLKAFFGKQFRVTEMQAADYRYRTYVSRQMLKFAMERAIDGIDYANFKSSVKDKFRHDTYMGVWGVMHRAQTEKHPPKLKPLKGGLWDRYYGAEREAAVARRSAAALARYDSLPLDLEWNVYGVLREPGDVMSDQGFRLPTRDDREYLVDNRTDVDG